MDQLFFSISLKDSKRSKRGRGFTLIEIMIVVVILGILAAVVVPQFTNASTLARENTLKAELRYLRSQITVFRAEHHDVSPGYPGGIASVSPNTDDFIAQMTRFSDDACATSGLQSARFRYGPYMQKMPLNPINNKDAIRVVSNNAALPAPTGVNGWIYKPQTQEIIPDLTGNDSDGKPYSQY